MVQRYRMGLRLPDVVTLPNVTEVTRWWDVTECDRGYQMVGRYRMRLRLSDGVTLPDGTEVTRCRDVTE